MTKLIKITEDIRKYAAEQGHAKEEVLRAGLHDRSAEFWEKARRSTPLLDTFAACQPALLLVAILRVHLRKAAEIRE